MKKQNNLLSCYKEMVANNRYRVLANNSYDKYERPLDRRFTTEPPPELTDVRI